MVLRDLVRQWFAKAELDYCAAERLVKDPEPLREIIAFHCQQAVEKYIKAILVYCEIDFQRSHNLIYLLDLLTGKLEISEDRYDKAILLNGFSVQIRYPDKTIYLSNEELATAIEIAQDFRVFAVELIGIKDL